MQNENEITLEKQGEVTIMDIRGDVTAFSEPFLKEAYQTASSQGADRILLKMDPQAYINSGGIAVLIQILAQTRQKKQRIGITNHQICQNIQYGGGRTGNIIVRAGLGLREKVDTRV
jgi:anti-anti-sigma factor